MRYVSNQPSVLTIVVRIHVKGSPPMLAGTAERSIPPWIEAGRTDPVADGHLGDPEWHWVVPTRERIRDNVQRLSRGVDFRKRDTADASHRREPPKDQTHPGAISQKQPIQMSAY